MGDAALKMHILKQTARRCVPCVSKVFETKLPSLRGEIGCMGVYWWRSAQDAHSETDGAALCAVCFKTLRDEAPVVSWRNGLYGCILVTQRSTCTFWNRRRGVVCREFQRSSWRSSRRASWRNGLYGCILVTQRSTCTFWNRRRGAVCRVFQKFSWRSSRRFVEKWVVWMYIKDAALQRHNLKQTARRCVPCVSKVFVTKLPSLRGEFDYMDVHWRRSAEMNFLNQMAPRCVLCVSKVYVTKLPSLRGEMVYMGVYWRRSAEMRILKQTAWHCVLHVSKLFVTKLPSLRGEMVYMGVYWRRSAELHIFKQTAWHCVLYVSKPFVTKLPALRGRGSSYLTKWWYNKSFETVGHLMDFRCRRMFQNCVHVAPGVAWRSVE